LAFSKKTETTSIDLRKAWAGWVSKTNRGNEKAMAESKRNEITYEQAMDLFYYKDGFLYKKKTNKKIESCGCGDYLSVMIKYKNYMVHRIIYLLHYKTLPFCVDHIDGNKLNNNIDNLRCATYTQNAYNRTKKQNTLTNEKNITYCKLKKKYKVQLQLDNKNKHFGYFSDLEDANKKLSIAIKALRSILK
jgi:hypothetical protein